MIYKKMVDIVKACYNDPNSEMMGLTDELRIQIVPRPDLMAILIISGTMLN